MNKLIACCGLDCEKCEARIATVNNDDNQRKMVAEKWSKMNSVSITPQMINCVGCMVDGVKTPFCDGMCDIRKCVVQKGFSSCGQCENMNDCKHLAMITGNNQEALENLKK